jgi:hypothetical protein
MSALHLGTEGYSNDGINGKVGIGTAAPQAVLDITGSYTSGDSTILGVKNNLTITAQNSGQLLLASSVTPTFIGDINQKVCLNVNPTSPLNGTTGVLINLQNCSGSGTSDSAGIWVAVDRVATGIVAGTNGPGIAIRGAGYAIGSTGGVFSGIEYALRTETGKVFFANNVGIGVEIPTQKLDVNGNIQCSGNIGIGTTTPSEKLYISGDSARFIIKGVTNTSFTATHIQNSDGDGVEMVSYGRSASGTYLGQNKAGAAFYGGSPNTVLGVGTRNVTPLAFGTNDTERMRITAGGNVGIGKTSPGSKLSVVGLPTSATGLTSGDIWRDAANGNVLKIVP